MMNTSKILYYPLKSFKHLIKGMLKGVKGVYLLLFWLLTKIPGYKKLPLYLQKGVALSLSLIIILQSLFGIFLFGPFKKNSSAAWFNDNWSYRTEYTVTHGSALTDRKIKIDIDTATLITAGKLQSDCDDSRFTNSQGVILEHFIDSVTGACNTSSTDYYVRIPTINNGSTVIIHYYGNVSAPNSRVNEFYAPYDGLGSGLVAYYKMDETSGTRADYAHINDMAASGAGGVTSGTGQIGTAGDFESSDSDFLSIADNADISMATSQQYTVTAWVNAESKPGTLMDFVAKSGTQTDYELTWRHTNDRLVHANAPSQAVDADNYGALQTSTWLFVVGWYDGTNMNISVNNGTANSTTDGGTSDGNGTLRIGSFDGTGRYFDGLIDEVRIYKKSLSAAERADLYTLGTQGRDFPVPQTLTPSGGPTGGSEEKATAPVGYWKFDDGTGTTAQDSTSNNKDGTITGATWQTEDLCMMGKCLYFDSTDKVAVDTSTGIINPTNPFSLSAWVKVTDLSTHRVIYSQTNSGDADALFDFIIPTTGRTYLQVRNTAGTGYVAVQLDSGDALSTNKWYHLTVTSNGSNSMQLYVDGVLKKTSTDSISGTYTYTLSDIGARAVESLYFRGFIDDTKIYNSALSAAQIQASYASAGNPDGLAGSVLGANDENMPGALSSGLVGYWKMDEASGNLTDSSGNSNTGTDTSTTVAAAKFGNGRTFNGTSSRVQAAYSSSLDVGNGDFAIGGWVKTGSIGVTRMIFSNYNVNASYMQFLLLSTGKLAFVARNASDISGSMTGNTNLSATTWYHLMVVRSGTTMRIYINGVEETLSAGSSTFPTGDFWEGSAKLDIGNEATNGGQTTFNATEWFNGTLDEFRIYNKALSPSEISQLYNFAPGPKAHWKFDENTGTSAFDTASSANTGTLSGDTIWRSGKYGGALDFDGTGDLVTVANESNFDFERTNAFSISSWVNITDQTQSIFPIYAKTSGPGTCDERGIALYVRPSSAGIDATVENDSCPGNRLFWRRFGDIVLTGWSHIMMTYDGSSAIGGLKVYVNGTEQVATTTENTLNATTLNDASPTIGGTVGGGSGYAKGGIDDVKIYNYVRTQKQIVEDINAGHPAVGSPVASAIAHWRFDEGADNMCSGGSNDVCNSGNQGSGLDGAGNTFTSPATSTSGWTQGGKFGRGLTFDGSSDYISMSSATGLPTGATERTISAWVKPSSSLQDGVVMSWGSNSANQLSGLRMLSSGKVRCNSHTNDLDSNDSITAGSWHHIACVYDGTKWTAYINGKPSGTLSVTLNTTNGANTPAIGRLNYTAANFFFGAIDDVKVYGGALTAEEIKLDFNRGASQVLGAQGDSSTYEKQAANQEYCVPGDSTSCAAPVIRWDFSEGSGTTANDTSGNNNAGTLTSGPTYKSGKLGKAVNFDGTDDYVVKTSANNYPTSSTDGTWETWFYARTCSGNLGILTTGGMDADTSTSNTSMRIYCRGSDNTITYGIGWDFDQNAPSSDLTNAWHHVVLTRTSAGVWNLYIDGVVKSTITDSSPWQKNNLVLGRFSGGGAPANYWNGLMDGVKVYNYVRTPAQVAWSYNRGAPIAHYRLDECQGGSVNDSSGNNNTGTINLSTTGTQTTTIGTGTCTTNAQTPWYNGRTGKFNSSLNFDGTSDYVSASDSNLPSSSNSRALSVWVNPTSLPSNNSYFVAMVYGTASTNNGSGLNLFNNSGTHQVCFAGYSNDLCYSYTTPTSSWTHLLGTFNGTTATLYINGVQVTSANKSTWNTTLGGTLYIGKNIPAALYFNGQIDDVRIYNYPLTQTQIKDLYSGGAASFRPSTGTPQ